MLAGSDASALARLRLAHGAAGRDVSLRPRPPEPMGSAVVLLISSIESAEVTLKIETSLISAR